MALGLSVLSSTRTYSPTHNFHLTCPYLNEDNRKTGIRRWFSLRIPVFRPLSPLPKVCLGRGDKGGMGELLPTPSTIHMYGMDVGDIGSSSER